MQCAYISPSGWHEDSPRTFVVSLPRPLPDGAPLLAENGERIGRVVTVWPTTREGRASVRLRIEPRHIEYALALRPDLLARRRNLAVMPDGRLMVAGPIDTAHISAAAAQVQRAPVWQGPLHVVV